MARIIQYPAHVTYYNEHGIVAGRLLVTDGTTIREHTEYCIGMAMDAGLGAVEICRLDGTIFQTHLPAHG